MKKLCLLSICVAALIVASNSASAPGGTRHVSPSGTDTGNCVSSPCLTIGYAVGQAVAGDVVEVATGTYAESVEVTKQLTLSGSAATIDATGHDNGIVVSGPAAAGTKVRGFTVEHADLEGILAQMTSHLVIADNTLVDNDLAGIGSPKCQSQDDCGEAIHLLSVTGSVVSGNSVHDNIGGILLTDEAGPTAWNLIVGNAVNDNVEDCGITLASHFFSLTRPASPDVGGVYQNLVLHNTANGNGAAGIGFFTGPPRGCSLGQCCDREHRQRERHPGHCDPQPHAGSEREREHRRRQQSGQQRPRRRRRCHRRPDRHQRVQRGDTDLGHGHRGQPDC